MPECPEIIQEKGELGLDSNPLHIYIEGSLTETIALSSE